MNSRLQPSLVLAPGFHGHGVLVTAFMAVIRRIARKHMIPKAATRIIISIGFECAPTVRNTLAKARGTNRRAVFHVGSGFGSGPKVIGGFALGSVKGAPQN